ncbi:3-deoxy-D-manno-oct-2-ulosonate III transferase WaaZ [Pluralibacter gergoviae]|uniref:3-deoxy-D-manno-oct-2-ulosonate III transferase WaaZ n=1 Tax=Pluralibacter gergoviae TaxID=61647 RepID=UPI0004F74C95|nr:3-deoxy-D-manno-oct-2-ulosonate III transferase WaaZ [Pluralibacter gergoviae]AIQ98993.1 3-deoxy-D-manno-oct-2-ulosonate III transferase WaaZ [Pluralibacter gergoviae]EKZ9515786.1 3-deoxy-D-manno-oct-2-ulosonate III transferase WaaZ [Pluralibacter gergoviae]ELC3017836.1 3-deoxy-D-manno-oct-2-ulosonate III transferase WaaZ [Pluralibacter gergoviae]ELC3022962.1 3-deoxy-D-manno-oct-2-ulosonate III transferase WaaZ [Pluralibacter gergoviae]ELC3073111.1 3-deoxy-D-manno-oct-2-ulosonate III transf
MNTVTYISENDVSHLIANKTSPDAIIFLSGPTSKNTPLAILRQSDVIAVNGSAAYLLANNIQPYMYVLTDVRFLKSRRDDFYRFSKGSRFTIVNNDVYEKASVEDQHYILNHCYVMRSFYKREKGGVMKKLKFMLLGARHKDLLMSVPFSRKGRLVGFCKDITLGYCSCHTVAFAAIQIAYSLKYSRIICSGLDLTGGCTRFYHEGNDALPSELSRDLLKILPFFRFMREKVSDINIYNLSDDTAVSYDIIPFITTAEV